jgi:hypothetical protein
MAGTERTVSEAVLTAVAEREGVAEHELRPPLYDVINPEALDALFREATGSVTFEYLGYRVTVDSDCTVTLASSGAD